MTLLFVCTGNICRSALADRVATRWLGPEIAVRSAGTHAVDGRPMHPLTAAVLERHGGTAGSFRSRHLRPEMVADADLVLTMSAEHRDAVLEMSPRHMRSVFTLLEAAALGRSVPAEQLAALPVRDRPQRLAALLAEARSIRPRDRARTDDIVDPISGTEVLHARVGAEVADAVRSLIDLLDGGAPLNERTVRMTRLPPVPPRTDGRASDSRGLRAVRLRRR
jgi:protein-tyrosine phosphatase